MAAFLMLLRLPIANCRLQTRNDKYIKAPSIAKQSSRDLRINSFLSLRPVFFICHPGLRAGVQVNIDSLATWIPGQARNDSYMSVIPRLRSNRPGIYELTFSCHSDLFLYLSLRPVFLSVTPASEPESRSILIP